MVLSGCTKSIVGVQVVSITKLTHRWLRSITKPSSQQKAVNVLIKWAHNWRPDMVVTLSADRNLLSSCPIDWSQLWCLCQGRRTAKLQDDGEWRWRMHSHWSSLRLVIMERKTSTFFSMRHNLWGEFMRLDQRCVMLAIDDDHGRTPRWRTWPASVFGVLHFMKKIRQVKWRSIVWSVKMF